ncbi:MAG: hypothetical protein PHU08_02790 [Dehalococcoidales bacterium]|nr:hypothetical protein [Dehalococcoidales bacterium]
MYEVRVPQLSDTMEETQLLEWVAKEGEKVKPRQVLVVLETEKASFEMESEQAGILHIISPVEVTIPVGHLIAILAENDQEYAKVKSQVETAESLKSLKK